MSIVGLHLPPPSPDPGFVLRTPRLVLRPLTAADRTEFLRVFAVSREHFAPWLPTFADMGVKDEAEFFENQVTRAQAARADGSALRLAAFDDQARLVGTFSLNNIVRGVFQNAYAGWQVSADRLRQGFAVEALRALYSHAFKPGAAGGLGLHRIQAAIIPSNTASLAVAARLAMRREGLAERYLKIDGHWQDHVLLAVTVESWPGDVLANQSQ